MNRENSKTIDDTKYETLCTDCQQELNLEIPQIHGQAVFKGHFKPESCDRCQTNLN